MMLSILKSEIARLRQEESGVALMMTLSIFMLLFVLCAGVYSIGETVRQKVELQNACDSAAYSAALVQADGLSRMAMVNRAMSWTYVQLTNMQIDYITYKWLQLVRRRFEDDKTMCQNNLKVDLKKVKIPNIQLGLASVTCKGCDYNGRLSEGGWGWLCGIAGKGMDMVRLNSPSHAVPVSAIDHALDQCSYMEGYYDAITSLKQTIETYNTLLPVISQNMHLSMSQTAAAVLAQNLPRDENGKIDMDLASDFVFFQDVPFPMAENEADPESPFISPYDITEPDENGNPVGVGYFSPLLNTELGERIFLTMADGEVYDTLLDYFGPSGDDTRIAGGLDQWFIRCGTNETFRNAGRVYPTDDKRAYRQFGICRAYKNANRVGNVQLTYRDHHYMLGNGDATPSCLNTRQNCPEKCHAVPDSTGLVADYEWLSGRYKSRCYHYHLRIKKKTFCGHVHTYDTKYLAACTAGHSCSVPAGVDHPRNSYYSCVAHSKKLKIKSIPWIPVIIFPPCTGRMYNLGFTGEGFGSFFGRLTGGLGGMSSASDPLPTSEFYWRIYEWFAKISNNSDPNGFARIYGDDKDLVKAFPEAYAGMPAKPWLLNDSFYGKDGAIIVGLARKQRNPWVSLFSSMSDVVTSDKVDEAGIYSAFNPVKDGYIVAFSAARAAHRFHPSDAALAWTEQHSDAPPLYGMAEGEYEARYDAVCDDAKYDSSGKYVGRFYLLCDDTDLLKMRVGCVCNDIENGSRFARCWNLCETDWDATLLPLRYAWAGVKDGSDWFDSFRRDTGGGMGVDWEEVGRDGTYGLTPFQYVAAFSSSWAKLYDTSGNQVSVDSKGDIKPQFRITSNVLGAKAPMNPQKVMTIQIDAPYSRFNVDDVQRVDTNGLDPSKLHEVKIL